MGTKLASSSKLSGEPDKEHSRIEFLLAEFQSLRAEIDLQIAERRKIEGQVVIGIAAIYSWLLTREPSINPQLITGGFVLPVVIVFLGFVRWAALMLTVMNLGRYIRRLEEVLGAETDGWERFLGQQRSNHKILGQFEGVSGVIFWATLALGSCYALWWVSTTGQLRVAPSASLVERLFGL